MSSVLETICPECGRDVLIRRESVYDGFRKIGERLFCASCGHEFENSEVPVKMAVDRPSLFTDADRSHVPDIFSDDEQKNCRRCEHYTVNPFTQRCGLNNRVVDATDFCEKFSESPDSD